MSSLIGWFGSRYVEDSYGSDAPFCDMYSTQLRVSLFVFLLLALIGGILLAGCILLVALLPDSFLRFLRFFPLSFPQRYPWHLDSTAVVLVPILWIAVGFLGYFLNGLAVLPSCACTVVVGRWLLASIVRMSKACHTRVPSDIILWVTPQ